MNTNTDFDKIDKVLLKIMGKVQINDRGSIIILI